MTKLDDGQIGSLVDKGARRWRKSGHDRIYINAGELGLECEYYRTGSIRHATWCGHRISNADAYRLKGGKAYVDVATGELHVRSNFRGEPTVEERARMFVEAALSEA